METEDPHTPFEDDTLDDAVAGADDTGLITQQQLIVESETETGLDRAP